MLIYAALILLIGIALVIIGIAGSRDSAPGQRKILIEGVNGNKVYRRSFLSTIIPFSQGLLEKLKLDVKLKNKLDAAHLKFTPVEFFNFKLLFIAALMLTAHFVFEQSQPVILAIVFCAGYVIPDLWLNKKISSRRQLIGRLLPETVDLLGLCIEAGLDFSAAINWIIEKGSAANPIIEEFAFVLQEISWGKPRSQALKDMAVRLNVPEVNSFVQVVVQAERLGTPVAEAFTILSEDTRLQRFHRGERVAMKAPIKILIPLIFCILPVIGIIIAGPIFLQFSQGSFIKTF